MMYKLVIPTVIAIVLLTCKPASDDSYDKKQQENMEEKYDLREREKEDSLRNRDILTKKQLIERLTLL